MNQLTPINLILFACGISLHFLIWLMDEKKDNKPVGFLIFLSNNWIKIAINLIAGIALLLMSEDMVKMLGLFHSSSSVPFYQFNSFMCGFMPYLLLMYIQKFVKKFIGDDPDKK
jgi:hypothetical protein